MSDLISRSALMKDIEYYISHTQEDSGEHYAYKQCKKLIERQPPVEPVRGEWKSREKYNDYLWAECSECGFQQENYKVVELGYSSCDYVGVKWNFCPKCGADMRGEKND